jgi:hypothetical protein
LLVGKFQTFYEPEDLLLYLKEPAIGPHLESLQYRLSNSVSLRSTLILSSFLRLSTPSNLISVRQIFGLKWCTPYAFLTHEQSPVLLLWREGVQTKNFISELRSSLLRLIALITLGIILIFISLLVYLITFSKCNCFQKLGRVANSCLDPPLPALMPLLDSIALRLSALNS